jgi:hypothetical protein
MTRAEAILANGMKDIDARPAGYASVRLAGVIVACALLGLPLPAQAQTPADALGVCYRDVAVAAAAKSCDSPETVVEDTFRACASQERALYRVLAQAGSIYGDQFAENAFNRVKATSRASLLTLVVRTRTENGLCR